MTPKLRLAVRSAALFLVSLLLAWQAAGFSLTKAAGLAVATAALQAIVELLGPTSDAGVKWSSGP